MFILIESLKTLCCQPNHHGVCQKARL